MKYEEKKCIKKVAWNQEVNNYNATCWQTVKLFFWDLLIFASIKIILFHNMFYRYSTYLKNY